MDDAERFRTRAKECRDLAPTARVEEIRTYLLQLAQDLEEEAERIEAEQDNGLKEG